MRVYTPLSMRVTHNGAVRTNHPIVIDFFTKLRSQVLCERRRLAVELSNTRCSISVKDIVNVDKQMAYSKQFDCMRIIASKPEPKSQQTLVPNYISISIINIHKCSPPSIGPPAIITTKDMIAHVHNRVSPLHSCRKNQKSSSG